MRTHSKFSPSSAYRWLHCTGSIEYQDHNAEPSEAAIEGTKAHEIVEHLVNGGKPFKVGDTIRVTSGKILYDETLHDAATMYCDFVRSKENEMGAKAVIEKQVHLAGLPVYGTPDAVIFDPFFKLVVIDFKYGVGEIVSPFKNKQLIIYALSYLGTVADPTEIELCIVQPRSYEDTKIKIWNTTPSELYEWVPKINDAVRQHEAGEHQYVAGSWCQWCPGTGQCPEVKKSIDLALEGANTIDVMVKILNARKLIKESIKKVEQQAYDYLMQGGEIPGYKLVRSLGNRVWTDPEKAKKKFTQKRACELRVLSPAKLEKSATKSEKKWIEKNTQKPNQGLVLAPESDRRIAELPNKIEDAFGEIGDKTE